MTRPPRSRPSGQSPLLSVQVEPVRIPAKDQALESQSPPTSPPAEAPSTVAAESARLPSAPEAVERRHEQTSPAQHRTPISYQTGPKATTSLALFIELKARAETAVLRTAGHEGGARSLTALINEAIAREVIRLEGEFNEGQPFEPNTGAFRMGRPFGS